MIYSKLTIVNFAARCCEGMSRSELKTDKNGKKFYDVLLANFFVKNRSLFQGEKKDIVKRLMNEFGISKVWAYKIIARLEELGVLEKD